MAPLVTQLSESIDDARARVAELSWYHTIEIAPGLTSPGWWDLRGALPRLPFPDVQGKRCLDIGPWDGFYTYELWRRGASEVVAVDIPDLALLDYPPEVRARSEVARSDEERAAGFHLIKDLTAAPVEWRGVSIYDLDPGEVGAFDVVVCGSLLLHLRDPVAALDAVRSVTRGELMTIDFVQVALNLRSRRRPLFELRGVGADFQWWLGGDAGQRHLLEVGGFEILEESNRFLLVNGAHHAPARSDVGVIRERLSNWLFTGDARRGHPHRAFVCRPRF